MVTRLNVVAVAVCDVTSKPRRRGVTLTYLPAWCDLDLLTGSRDLDLLTGVA